MRALELAVLAAGSACAPSSLDVLDPTSTSLDAGAASVDGTSPYDATSEDGFADAPPPDAPAGDEGACSRGANGAPCTRSSQCCSGWCPLPGPPAPVCAAAVGCLAFGASCTFAGECCSLSCVARPDGVGTCADTPPCASAGATCSAGVDCCSGACAATKCAASSAPCKPAGEACGGPAECCGELCGPAGPGMMKRCGLLEGCRVEGEVCARSADCCTGLCVLDATSVGHCAALPACTENDHKTCTRQVGEACGGNDDCCSRSCQPLPGGPKVCVPASGCRAECETCGSGADCCSGVCGTGVSDFEARCQAAPSTCGADGEMCGGNADCCTPATCVPDPPPSGARRCRVATGDGACRPDGAPCALGAECCGGRCDPWADAGLVCGSSCLALGSACTSNGDCCAAAPLCVRVNGALVCAPGAP